jgi:hypothetical protein
MLRLRILSPAFAGLSVLALLGGCSKEAPDCNCPPMVNKVTPAVAPVGTAVALEGYNFDAGGNNQVLINGVPAAITAASATRLDIVVPAGVYSQTKPYGQIVVKSQGREGGQAQIFSEDYPQITSIQPASGPVGTVVTITGKNFNPSIAGNRLLFWSAPAGPQAPTSASSTSLQVVVPAGAKTGPLNLYKYVKGEFGQTDAEYVSQSSPVDFTVTP